HGQVVKPTIVPRAGVCGCGLWPTEDPCSAQMRWKGLYPPADFFLGASTAGEPAGRRWNRMVQTSLFERAKADIGDGPELEDS
ncbi:hypothetical protein AB0N17_45715, partial [Streptomyces sp. NPDC051133]|uniref:hypothetical protein n=1 Tax=Streptomyces sp. NPDC051133 TaxID=3155521 RepID=UPI003413B41B